MEFGRFVHACEVVGSTQDVAREMALGGAPAGTVVTAEFQTAGRGRQGRVWHAPRGANVCLTAIGEPIPAADAWQIAFVAAVGVAAGIAQTARVGPSVKFPNDVLLGGRKVAGVLVETAPATRAGEVIPLLGIGINVRTPGADIPPEVAVIATSLEEQADPESPPTVAAVQRDVLRRLSGSWGEWRRSGLGILLGEWKRFADPNLRRVFVLDGQPVSCRVLDIAADGTVTLESEDGVRHHIHAAQVLWE